MYLAHIKITISSSIITSKKKEQNFILEILSRSLGEEFNDDRINFQIFSKRDDEKREEG